MSESEGLETLEGLHILAVDDEPDVLESMVDVLEDAKVDTAESFEAALAKLEVNSYDLAILDIMGVNGQELLSETVKRDIPTVMLTAHAVSVETLKDSVNKGALAYLPKAELANLDALLVDLLATARRGGSTWQLLFDRLGDFFERAFGPKWAENDDPNFWRMYYPYF